VCDCYSHKCELCDHAVPMHIADFTWPREDFKVWCADHVDDAPSIAVTFEMLADDPYGEWGDPSEKKGWRCAIAGPNVGLDAGVHPNLGPMKDSFGSVDDEY